MSVHPVLALLRDRAAANSRPGARADGATLALALEGGGMRGVISAGMATALERRGLLDSFDAVVGTSAGALNGAAFLAGVVGGSVAAYAGPFTSRRFINPYRALIGRAVVDVAYTLDHADERLDGRRHARVITGGGALHCVAVDVATAQPVALGDLRNEEELRSALLASSRMPWVGGDPVRFRDRVWLDGGLAAPIPARAAIERGATHVLALMTRPLGAARAPLPRLVNVAIERRLRALNPDLVALHRRRTSDYEEIIAEITVASEGPGPEPPFVFGLRLPQGVEEVSQLERRPTVLAEAGRMAVAHAEAVLDAAGIPPG